MTDRTDTLWTHRGNKFVIGTIHGRMIEVEAQYNPREVARSAAASWHAHPNTSSRQSKAGDNYELTPSAGAAGVNRSAGNDAIRSLLVRCHSAASSRGTP